MKTRRYALRVIGSIDGVEVELELNNDQQNWLEMIVAKVNVNAKGEHQPVMDLTRIV